MTVGAKLLFPRATTFSGGLCKSKHILINVAQRRNTSFLMSTQNYHLATLMASQARVASLAPWAQAVSSSDDVR